MEIGNIYETKEWKDISLSNRASLIPLIENVRLGAQLEIFEKEKGSLKYCLNKLKLKYKINKQNSLFVSRNETLSENMAAIEDRYCEIICQKKVVSEEGFDEISKKEFAFYATTYGNFVCYPECCIEDFVKKNLAGIMVGEEFNKKAKEALEESKYNEVLDYRLHFPCKLDCKETIKMAKGIKTSLELKDTKAAEWLKRNNRKLIIG